jgi:hypothetical protein
MEPSNESLEDVNRAGTVRITEIHTGSLLNVPKDRDEIAHLA